MTTTPTYPIRGFDGRAVVLASGSPRRRQLLESIGVTLEVVEPDVDETPIVGELVDDLVVRLAAAKVAAVAAQRPGAIVIGADTAVQIDGEILGKPVDEDDARRILRLLSGRAHRVVTGVAVADSTGTSVAVSSTEVTFVGIGDAEIDWYVRTGEPLDKAGAYALQGAGGAFVESVRGSVSGVLGLPLDVTVRLLSQAPSRPAPG